MKEFTLRAVLLGLVMCVVLGAANAYLGLKAGQTIAATYPAAVIGMAVLRLFKRHDPRREHRANRGVDRRIGGGRRGLHHSGVRDFAFVAGFFARHRVLEIDGADDDRQHPGRAVRVAGATRAGGRPGPAVSRIGGGVADPQGRPDGRASGEASFLQHGDRRAGLSRQRVQHLRAG